MDLQSDWYRSGDTRSSLRKPRNKRPYNSSTDTSYLLQTLQTPTDARYPLLQDINQSGNLNHNAFQETLQQQSGVSSGSGEKTNFWKIFNNLLILSVVFWNHPSGLLVVIGLEILIWFANAYLVQLANKDFLKRTVAGRNLNVYFVRLQAVGLVSVVFGVAWRICNDGLQESFWQVFTFSLPSYWEPTFYMVIWVTLLADYCILFLTIGIKGVVCVMPDFVIRTLGKILSYVGIEITVQMYRQILPIRPWFNLLTGWITGGSYLIGTVCFAFYFILKILVVGFGSLLMFAGVALFIYAIIKSGINLGRPTPAELSTAYCCSVCMDDFRDPVMLECKHIFCEECILIWCDKNSECPLCRRPVTLIVQQLMKQWRPGATEFSHSVY